MAWNLINSTVLHQMSNFHHFSRSLWPMWHGAKRTIPVSIFSQLIIAYNEDGGLKLWYRGLIIQTCLRYIFSLRTASGYAKAKNRPAASNRTVSAIWSLIFKSSLICTGKCSAVISPASPILSVRCRLAGKVRSNIKLKWCSEQACVWM